MKRQGGVQQIVGGAHHAINGISQNGFIMSQSANNSASNSRRTSQKSNKTALGYQTQINQKAGANGGTQLGGNP